MIFVLPYDILAKTIAWSIASTISILVGIFFLKYANLDKGEVENRALIDVKIRYALFFWGWALTRLLFLFSDYEYGKANVETPLYVVFLFTGYLTTLLAMMFLTDLLEPRIRPNKKKIVTTSLAVAIVITIISSIISFFNPTLVRIARGIIFSVLGISGAIIFGFYVFLIIKTTGIVKKRAILNFSGICFIFMGQFFDSTYMIHYFYSIIWLPAIISALGVILFFLGHKIES